MDDLDQADAGRFFVDPSMSSVSVRARARPAISRKISIG